MLKQFEQMRGMMKQMQGGGMKKLMRRMGGMSGLPPMMR
jgi:signal recognition particle subunit SRP54